MSVLKVDGHEPVQRPGMRLRVPKIRYWAYLHPFLLLMLVACGPDDPATAVPAPSSPLPELVPVQAKFADSLVVDRGGFIDIPLHNSVAGDVLTLGTGPAPLNGTLTLVADAAAVRYQSNGIGVGEERFTFTILRGQPLVEEHVVWLMVRRTDARPNILFVLTDD